MPLVGRMCTDRVVIGAFAHEPWEGRVPPRDASLTGTAGVIQVPAGTVQAKFRDPADLAEADVAADGMVPLRIVIRAAPTPMQTVGHSHPQARAAASRLSRPRGQRRTPTRHTAPCSRRAGAGGRGRRSQCSNTCRSSADSAPHNSSAPRQKHQRHATDDPVGAGAPAFGAPSVGRADPALRTSFSIPCGVGNLRAGAGPGRERLPGSPGLPDQRRVDDQVPERPDRGHVATPEQAVRLDQDGHLAAVAAKVVGDPAEVQDPCMVWLAISAAHSSSSR